MRGNREREAQLCMRYTLRSPDELNEVVRVTKPSVWVVLTAILLLLAGLLLWGLTGTVTDALSATAAAVDGRLCCFVPESQSGTLAPGMRVIFGSGQTGVVLAVGEAPLSEAELDALPGGALLRQKSGLTGWTRALTLEADGLSGAGPFPLSIVKEECRPINLLLGGGL